MNKQQMIERNLQAHRTIDRAGMTKPDTVAVGIKVLAVAIVAAAMMGRGMEKGSIGILLKVLGGLLVIGLGYLLSRRPDVPTEIRLYFSFLAWSLLTAFLLAEAPYLSFQHGWTVFQMGLVFWAVMVAHIWRPDIRLVMLGLWGLAMSLIFITALDPELLSVVQAGRERLQVMEQNPNGVAEVWVIGIFAALYLADRFRSALLKYLILGSIIPMSMLILFTASRKMLIAEILVFAVWGITRALEKGRGGLRKLWPIVSLLLIGIAAAYISISIWERSPMSARWKVLTSSSAKEGQFGGRDRLYIEGIKLFLKEPITGVGLANQEVHLGFSAVHSDYVDVLVSTGLVGAALYFHIYLSAIRRSRRNSKYRDSLSQLNRRAFFVYCVMMAWFMLGYQRYDDLFNLLFLGSFIGCFVSQEKTAKAAILTKSFPQSGGSKKVGGAQSLSRDLGLGVQVSVRPWKNKLGADHGGWVSS